MFSILKQYQTVPHLCNSVVPNNIMKDLLLLSLGKAPKTVFGILSGSGVGGSREIQNSGKMGLLDNILKVEGECPPF